MTKCIIGPLNDVNMCAVPKMTSEHLLSARWLDALAANMVLPADKRENALDHRENRQRLHVFAFICKKIPSD